MCLFLETTNASSVLATTVVLILFSAKTQILKLSNPSCCGRLSEPASVVGEINLYWTNELRSERLPVTTISTATYRPMILCSLSTRYLIYFCALTGLGTPHCVVASVPSLK
jgi:hypothetical protein